MNQKMDDKKINDKSFEQEKQQKRKNNPASDVSHPAMSYREVRAKSESEHRKRKQADKGKKSQNTPAKQQAKKRTSPQVQQKRPNNPSKGKKPDDEMHKNQDVGQQKNTQSNKPKQQVKKDSNRPQTQQKKTSKPQSKSKGKRPVPNTDRASQASDKEFSSERNNGSSEYRGTQPKKNTAVQQKQPRPTSEIDVKAEKEIDTKPLKPLKPFSAKKRRRKLLAVYTSMLLVILMISAVLCLTVFFKIDSISVEGDTRYSSDDIIDASGIAIGTNLLLCDTDSGLDVIQNEFPYIENVSIRKNPFNSVTIFVEEAVPTTAIETDGKFYILSAKGKIIEILDNNKYKVPLIKGAELKKTELSAQIEYKLDGMNGIINEITETLKSNELSNVSTINVTNPSNIKLSYDGRLTIIIGMPENIDYKIKTAKILINDKLEKDSKGTIDVSMCAEGGKYSYYDPSGAPEN